MIKQTQKEVIIRTAITDALEYYQALKDKREDYYNNRTENWMEGDKGQEYAEDNETVDSIVSDLESLLENLDMLYE
jgi:hypothetical protein